MTFVPDVQTPSGEEDASRTDSVSGIVAQPITSASNGDSLGVNSSVVPLTATNLGKCGQATRVALVREFIDSTENSGSQEKDFMKQQTTTHLLQSTGETVPAVSDITDNVMAIEINSEDNTPPRSPVDSSRSSSEGPRLFLPVSADPCRVLIYIENMGRHFEQDRFQDGDGLRRALLEGAGHVCRIAKSDVANRTCSCADLHLINLPDCDFADVVQIQVGHAAHRRRPFTPRERVLVLDYVRHFDVLEFQTTAGLQNAVMFGRGKMCRFGTSCPAPRNCLFLHFRGAQPATIKQRLRTLRSVFVRNINSRLNASQFVHDCALQRALSVGEGYVCTGHEGRMVCRLLHFDHRNVLSTLKGCRTIEDLEYFSAEYGLGRIVTPLEGLYRTATSLVVV